MKKLIIVLLLGVVSFTAVKAQDTTATSITDASKGYTYKNVYATATIVTVTYPNTRNGIVTVIDSTNMNKYNVVATFNVYASKADFKAGKVALLTYSGSLYTDKFPTQKDIDVLMRQVIK